MSTDNVIQFAIPDTLSQRAVLAQIREHLVDLGESPACIDFVLQTMGLIIDHSGMGKATRLDAKDEAEYAESIPLLRDQERFYSGVSGSLIAELVNAYTQIWHLENGG